MAGSKDQEKNGQNSDRSGWLQEAGGLGGGKRIRRNWMSRAIISIGVIRVQTVFQTGVWFCYKCSRQVPGSALDRILILCLAFQVRRVCLSFTAEY